MLFWSTTKKLWLERCPIEYRPFYYQRHVDDVFVLIKSPEHLKHFHSYSNCRHVNISFTIENEKDNRMSFHDVNIIREQSKSVTSVYGKPTFSEIYTHLDSFLPTTNKIGMIHTLLCRCFRVCSDWTKFHLELIKLMNVFESNGCPENFINNCLKTFLDNKHRIQKKVIIVPKKHLFLVLL